MALAMKACFLLRDVSVGVRLVSGENASLAQTLLQKALSINESSDFLHFIRAQYCYGVELDRDAANRAVERSFEVNPEYVLAKLAKAVVLAMDGRATEALALAEPVAPEFSKNAGYFRFLGVQALSHFVIGDHQKAVNSAKDALDRWPDYPLGLVVLASSAAHIGDTAMAQKTMSALLSIDPTLTIKLLRPLQFHQDATQEKLCEGLISAGMPIE